MKTTNQILYPLQDLKEFLDSGIYLDLKKFYASYENEFFGHRIKSINRKNHIIEYYKEFYLEGESKTEIASFTKTSKYILMSKINSCLLNIIGGFEGCITFAQPYSAYGNRILNQYQELKQLPSYSEFEFIPECLKSIKNEINHYLEPENIGDENEIYRKAPFVVKDNFKRNFFISLYDFALMNDIIDLDVPRESFIEVFTATSTDYKLRFNCSNSLMIIFFEGIKEAFEDLKPSSIEKSERFLTKQNNKLTVTNYESSKQRTKPSSKIIELKEELDSLVSSRK